MNLGLGFDENHSQGHNAPVITPCLVSDPQRVELCGVARLMPFRNYSSYFASDELDAFIAAYEAAWKHLCTTVTSHDQAAVLQKKLGQIILASACKGEREVEQLKAIALKALA
jgi:hypothetical protein